MRISILPILIGIWFTSNLALALSPALSQKLDLQWQQYAKARETLLENVRKTDLPVGQRVLTRTQWEEILTLTGDQAFTKEDLKALRKDQMKRAQISKLQSLRASVIDLNSVRKSHSAKEFCEKLPKGGMLHIHPSGTVDRPLAHQLLTELDPVLDFEPALSYIESSNGNSMLYPSEKEWLGQFKDKPKYSSLSSQNKSLFENFLFLPPGKQPFPRFNSVFEFLDFAIPAWEPFDQVLWAFSERAVRQGVSYVEFTYSAGENLYQRLQKIEEQTGLTIRVNQSFARTRSLEILDQKWKELRALPESKYLVGIDFLDNEDGHPAFEKGQLLYGSALEAFQSGKSNLRRTMHSGEIGDIRNPRDAMIMGAERLGHGVNLAKDPVALEYAVSVRQPLEINLSSNMRLSDVASISEHPFLLFLRLGLPVSLSTDDEGIFETDINQECRLAIEQTDVTYAEMKQMAFNSIRTSFAAPLDQERLLRKLEKAFQEFEKSKIRHKDVNRKAVSTKRIPMFSSFNMAS